MRSKLFVPASRPELFEKALRGAADAISFDLEDAVLPDRKDYAREQLLELLDSGAAAQSGKTIVVRINAADTPFFEQDLAVAGHPAVDVVNIPKVDAGEGVAAFAQRLDRVRGARPAGAAPARLLVNIETPRALLQAAGIAAAHPQVWGLQLGLGDLFEPLDIARYEAANVHAVMLAVRIAAGASGRVALDAAYVNVADAEGFRREAVQARNAGYLGKTCIHPSQVAIANEVFSPTEAEVAWARRILEAEADGGRNGAYLLDGKMVDAPFVQRAHAIVARADAASGQSAGAGAPARPE